MAISPLADPLLGAKLVAHLENMTPTEHRALAEMLINRLVMEANALNDRAATAARDGPRADLDEVVKKLMSATGYLLLAQRASQRQRTRVAYDTRGQPVVVVIPEGDAT